MNKPGNQLCEKTSICMLHITAALHKAAGCSHGTEVVAGDAARILMASERGCTEAEELGSQFLCPVQGWQRAGTVPATAARPSPAAASHGRMLALT